MFLYVDVVVFVQYVLYDFVCLSVSVKSITAKYSRFCIVSFLLPVCSM